MENRDLFIVHFYEKHISDEGRNWDIFLKMVSYVIFTFNTVD
jgi:hypothetical protein